MFPAVALRGLRAIKLNFVLRLCCSLPAYAVLASRSQRGHDRQLSPERVSMQNTITLYPARPLSGQLAACRTEAERSERKRCSDSAFSTGASAGNILQRHLVVFGSARAGFYRKWLLVRSSVNLQTRLRLIYENI